MKNIDAVSKLKLLETLDLSENSLTKISALNKLNHLTFLNLRMNEIEDIEPLGQLTNLVYLDLSYNNIHQLGAESLVVHFSQHRIFFTYLLLLTIFLCHRE